MAVRRIVANVATSDPTKADAFYKELLGLTCLMDQGWIRTYGSETEAPVQVSFAQQGGADTSVPNLSIEVDDVDAIHTKACEMELEITYPLKTEDWGVRRFYVRDPFGQIINILSHS